MSGSLPTTVHNERVKLSSRFLTNIGIVLVLGAIIGPILGRHDLIGLAGMVGFGVAGGLSIGAGFRLLRRLR
jgi:hypothetical protein